MAEDDKPKHSKMYPVPSSIQMMARAMLGTDPPAQDGVGGGMADEDVEKSRRQEFARVRRELEERSRQERAIQAQKRLAEANERLAQALERQQVAPAPPSPAPPTKRKGYPPPERLNCNLWLVKQYDFENGSTDDKTFYTDRVEEWQRIRREQDAEANEKRPLDRKKDRKKALANMRSAISKAREKRSRIA